MADKNRQAGAEAQPPWVFVHIQRTGGNAIRSALGLPDKEPNKHFSAQELKGVYGDAIWANSFKFAFVRNPWDRLVSWWSLIDNGRDPAGTTPAPNNFFGYVLTQARNFEEFLSNCTDEIVDKDGRKNIFRNQIDYLTSDNGSFMVDFIGRFERLQTDFDTIAGRLGLPQVALPKINHSRHAPYTEYYTASMAEKVRQRYHRDIAAFGYAFGK